MLGRINTTCEATGHSHTCSTRWSATTSVCPGTMKPLKQKTYLGSKLVDAQLGEMLFLCIWRSMFEAWANRSCRGPIALAVSGSSFDGAVAGTLTVSLNAPQMEHLQQVNPTCQRP